MELPTQGKIAKNQVDQRAYADVMEAKLRILKDYIGSLLGAPPGPTEEARKGEAGTGPKPEKRWWRFWK